MMIVYQTDLYEVRWSVTSNATKHSIHLFEVVRKEDKQLVGSHGYRVQAVRQVEFLELQHGLQEVLDEENGEIIP